MRATLSRMARCWSSSRRMPNKSNGAKPSHGVLRGISESLANSAACGVVWPAVAASPAASASAPPAPPEPAPAPAPPLTSSGVASPPRSAAELRNTAFAAAISLRHGTQTPTSSQSGQPQLCQVRQRHTHSFSLAVAAFRAAIVSRMRSAIACRACMGRSRDSKLSDPAGVSLLHRYKTRAERNVHILVHVHPHGLDLFEQTFGQRGLVC